MSNTGFLDKMKFIDYYKILGVERSATDSEIKTAFRNLALTYHPDKNLDKNTTAPMKVINEAYGVLMNSELRLKHDADLADYEPDSEDEDFVEQVRGVKGRATRRTARENGDLEIKIEYVRTISKKEEQWLRKLAARAEYRASKYGRSQNTKKSRRTAAFAAAFATCEDEDEDEDETSLPTAEGISVVSYEIEKTSPELATIDDVYLEKWQRNPYEVAPQPNAKLINNYLKHMDSRPEENIVRYEPKSRRREAKRMAPKKTEYGYKQANRGTKQQMGRKPEAVDIVLQKPDPEDMKPPSNPSPDPLIVVDAREYYRLVAEGREYGLSPEEQSDWNKQCYAALLQPRSTDEGYEI